MRVAIVTGATSGMGKEMVRLILEKEKGLEEVWLLGRRKQRLKYWREHYPEIDFRLLSLDLTDEGDREKFVQHLELEEPEVSLFVHAAGFGMMGFIEELSIKEQEEMVDLNVRSTVSMTGYVLPYMEQKGRMIYFASAAAFLPQPGFAVYAAGKAFVLSYVRSLRAECRDRELRITAVCPGAVKTEFFTRATLHKPLPAYKKLVMADPVKVVKKAWKDNEKGKEISVYGIPMKGFRLVTKLVPHRCFLRFMGKK